MAMHIVHDLVSAPQAIRQLASSLYAPRVLEQEVAANARPGGTHDAAGSYVTIGVFDGVHRGHQQLITRMVQAARSARKAAVAINFDPHPAITLGYEPPPLLTTVEERAELLAGLGLDVLVVLPFTPDLARTAATDFVGMLTTHLGLAGLWGGPDFALGHAREGDVPFLQHLGARQGFAVHIVEPLVWEGGVVSSSRVRTALNSGDVRQAMGCLGRPYRLTNVVVHGDGRGRLIGVPTANLPPPPGRLVPAGGIYACLAQTAHRGVHPAVVNIGTRPTFARNGLVVEAHLLDFHEDLYDRVLSLDFIARLRDERAFASSCALVGQIREDIAQARAILGGYASTASAI